MADHFVNRLTRHPRKLRQTSSAHPGQMSVLDALAQLVSRVLALRDGLLTPFGGAL